MKGTHEPHPLCSRASQGDIHHWQQGTALGGLRVKGQGREGPAHHIYQTVQGAHSRCMGANGSELMGGTWLAVQHQQHVNRLTSRASRHIPATLQEGPNSISLPATHAMNAIYATCKDMNVINSHVGAISECARAHLSWALLFVRFASVDP